MLNIVLGILAAIIWIGAFGWYFYRDIINSWKAYRTRWTN
jgi:hypothetical protein